MITVGKIYRAKTRKSPTLLEWPWYRPWHLTNNTIYLVVYVRSIPSKNFSLNNLGFKLAQSDIRYLSNRRDCSWSGYSFIYHVHRLYPCFHRPDLKGAPGLVGAEHKKASEYKRISENDLSKDSFHNNSILWFAGEKHCPKWSILPKKLFHILGEFIAVQCHEAKWGANQAVLRSTVQRTEWYHLINSKHRSKIVPKRNKNLNDLDYQPQDAIRRSTTSKLHMVTNDGNYTAHREMLHEILLTPTLLWCNDQVSFLHWQDVPTRTAMRLLCHCLRE